MGRYNYDLKLEDGTEIICTTLDESKKTLSIRFFNKAPLFMGVSKGHNVVYLDSVKPPYSGNKTIGFLTEIHKHNLDDECLELLNKDNSIRFFKKNKYKNERK